MFYKNRKENELKPGISLSGGGARGFMHLGVLKALEEHNLRPSVIVGTSSGAIAAALYAAGLTPEEIVKVMKDIKVKSLMKPSMTRRGLFDIQKATAFLNDMLPATFEELKMKLVVNTCDLLNGKSVFFSEGSLVEPLQASSCIPGFFKPVDFQGFTLVDGGVVNNMPAEPLMGECSFLIGSHSNYLGSIDQVANVRSIMERTFHLTINQNVELQRAKFDLVIEPALMAGTRVYDFSKAEANFEVGYEYTRQLLHQGIGELLPEADELPRLKA